MVKKQKITVLKMLKNWRITFFFILSYLIRMIDG